jgi:hypothetical protein
VINQGTELALVETRPSMSAGGFGSEGVDHFDTTSDGYAGLAALRPANPVLSRGALTPRRSSPAGPGVIASSRALGVAREVVVMNTAPTRVLVSGPGAELRPGQLLDVALGEGPGTAVVADHEGKLTFEFPAPASVVLLARDETFGGAPVGSPKLLDALGPITIPAR